MAARSPSINFLSRPARAKKRYERAGGKKEGRGEKKKIRASAANAILSTLLRTHTRLSFPFCATVLRLSPTRASHSLLAFARPISPCPRISIVAEGKTRFRPISPVRNLRLLGQSIFSNRDGGVSEIRKVSRRLIVELEIG